MTPRPRKEPWQLELLRLLGTVALVFVVVGSLVAAYGELFAWMSSTAWGANP